MWTINKIHSIVTVNINDPAVYYLLLFSNTTFLGLKKYVCCKDVEEVLLVQTWANWQVIFSKTLRFFFP